MKAKYPWLLPSSHPLYHPYYGFSRVMTSSATNRALAAWARRFAKDLAAFDAGKAA